MDSHNIDVLQKVQSPYGDILSSSSRGLQPIGCNGKALWETEERTDRRTDGKTNEWTNVCPSVRNKFKGVLITIIAGAHVFPSVVRHQFSTHYCQNGNNVVPCHGENMLQCHGNDVVSLHENDVVPCCGNYVVSCCGNDVERMWSRVVELNGLMLRELYGPRSWKLCGLLL